ncbi:SPOR domain-containing protein [Crocinitomicaceae bacterium]|nr:SPOR domain-containing protein [Crocinitomicaceae bacterium]
MTNLDSVLFDLLVHHNCVIIPEFGGFIAKRVSSQIDFEKGIILPPSKHLLFNRFLTADDGLLISSFVQAQKEDYDSIKIKLSNFVTELDKRLSNGEEVVFKHIGTLKRSENGNYTFKQDRSFNLLADAYGLKELDFVSVQEVKEEQEEVVADAIPVSVPNVKKSIGVRKILRYAAAACILPLAFYSFWIPFKSDFFSSGMISVNDFNPFYKKELGRYEPIPSKQIIKEQIKNEVQVVSELNPITQFEETVDVDKTVIVEELNPEKVNLKAESSTKVIYNKQFIVGCFAVKENAVNYQNKIEADGFFPVISKSGRLYRVSMGLTYSAGEYDRLISLVRSKGYNGWTLKTK